MRLHWFLPETPDVLGTLATQADVTVRGLTAFAAWAGGAADQGPVVRATEHEADGIRRTLQAQLRQAFSTPIDQEDLYSLSELLDDVLNAAKNIVREAEVLAVEPDERAAELAADLLEGMTHIRAAFAQLTGKTTWPPPRPTRRWPPSGAWRRCTGGPCRSCCLTKTCARWWPGVSCTGGCWRPGNGWPR